MFPLGIWHYLLGGLMIGIGVSFIYYTTGIHAGISTCLDSTFSYFSKARYFNKIELTRSRNWRLVFLSSLVFGAFLYAVLLEDGVIFTTEVQWWRLLIGGMLVGFGTRMSKGCTSGHGICGLGSMSKGSLAAVIAFFSIGILTALVVRSLGVLP